MDYHSVAVKLPKSLKEALKDVSRHSGLSENDLVILALVTFLSEPGRLSKATGSARTIFRDEKYLH